MATTYEVTIDFPMDEFLNINRLLAIESLEDLDEYDLKRLGAKQDDEQGIMYIAFDDGAVLTFDICSGSHNYYDNVVISKDGNEYVPECTFEFSKTIIVEAFDAIYKINLHLI